jgi:hypothetical protein
MVFEDVTGDRSSLPSVENRARNLICKAHLSCAWFLVGNGAYSDTGKHWTDQPGIDLLAYGDYRFTVGSDASLCLQYFCTFHWITAQVTLASCYVIPNSSTEAWIRSSSYLWLSL